MKTKLYILLVLLVSPFGFGASVTDDFNDGIINPDYWEVYLPQWDGQETGPVSNAHLTERNGFLNFDDGGVLTTVGDFINPTIQGSFSFHGWSADKFKVVFRSDGSINENWQNPQGGIGVQFVMTTNPDYTTNACIQLKDFTIDGSIESLLAEAYYPIEYQQTYEFEIIDDGENISIFMDGSLTPILSFDTLISYGGKVQMANQSYVLDPAFVDVLNYYQLPMPDDSYLLSLDNVTIHTPEPNVLLFVLVGVLWLLYFNKFNQR